MEQWQEDVDTEHGNAVRPGFGQSWVILSASAHCWALSILVTKADDIPKLLLDAFSVSLGQSLFPFLLFIPLAVKTGWCSQDYIYHRTIASLLGPSTKACFSK